MKIISYDDINDFIIRYGKKTTKSLIKNSVIELQIPSTYELLQLGFKKPNIGAVRNNLKNGKLVEHLNKTNGRVKKKYYGITIGKYIDDLPVKQNVLNELILKRLYTRMCNKYKLKFTDVNTDYDPITCEELHDPCYIVPDWNSGCKIIYNWDTLIKCKATRRIYTGFDIDESGQTIYYYREVFEGHYVSPYTKKIFYTSDIRTISMDLLKTVKKKILT